MLAATLAASLAVPLRAQEPCHWWQFRCDDAKVEGLPEEAPHDGTVITVDVSSNTLYLFEDGKAVVKAPVATGTGKLLRKGNKFWAFHTPRGHLKVLRKIVDPVWRKPDWAFIEDGEPIPKSLADRLDPDVLGNYALALPDGYLSHGSLYKRSLGMSVTHGCIRVGADDLEAVYKSSQLGTKVYII